MVETMDMNLSVEDTRKTLIDFKEKTGYSQTQIAKLLGASDTTVSQLLSGTYPTAHNYVGKIEQLVRLNAKKEVSPKEPEFKETSISKRVMETIEYAHMQIKDTISVACGDAGTGKTMAIEEYVRRNPDTTVVIEASPTFSTRVAVAKILANELRIDKRNSFDIHMELRKRLTGTNTVIIVDEAQSLSFEAIEDLRCLTKDCRIGLALVGNMEILSKMTGDKEEKFSRVNSRMIKQTDIFINQITPKDIRLVFEDSQLDDESLDLLYRISQTKRGIRSAIHVFINTAAHFGEIDVSKLAAIAKDMHINYRRDKL